MFVQTTEAIADSFLYKYAVVLCVFDKDHIKVL